MLYQPQRGGRFVAAGFNPAQKDKKAIASDMGYSDKTKAYPEEVYSVCESKSGSTQVEWSVETQTTADHGHGKKQGTMKSSLLGDQRVIKQLSHYKVVIKTN